MRSHASPDVRQFYLDRFARMLRDLDIAPASLITDRDLSLHDGGGNRRLSPPLGNQTLAEGLVAAVKLAELVLDDDRHERAVRRLD